LGKGRDDRSPPRQNENEAAIGGSRLSYTYVTAIRRG